MIAELVYQMAYTALRAPEIDKSNASYRPLSHRTLVDAHRSRAWSMIVLMVRAHRPHSALQPKQP